MLHNEARKLLVESYEATHDAKEIAKIFHVNKYTVYHLEELKRKTGSVDLQTWRRGRKALLNSDDKTRIAQCSGKLAAELPYFCRRWSLRHLPSSLPVTAWAGLLLRRL